jgi:hypothetical protein
LFSKKPFNDSAVRGAAEWRLFMLRKNLLLVFSLGAVFVCAGARADVCFQYDGQAPLVAKGAKLPPPNACIPVPVVEQDFQPGQLSRVGIATGSLCMGDPGSGNPIVVFQYTYDACGGPGSYFESATCRIDILSSSGGGVISLPTENPGSKQSSFCNGVFTGLLPNQAGGLRQFTDQSLRVWDCTNSNFHVPAGNILDCNGAALGPSGARRFLFPPPDGMMTPRGR